MRSPPKVWETFILIHKIEYLPDNEIKIEKPLPSKSVAPRSKEEGGDYGEEVVDYTLVNTKLSHCVLGNRDVLRESTLTWHVLRNRDVIRKSTLT